jgi:hypothetical protein
MPDSDQFGRDRGAKRYRRAGGLAGRSQQVREMFERALTFVAGGGALATAAEALDVALGRVEQRVGPSDDLAE